MSFIWIPLKKQKESHNSWSGAASSSRVLASNAAWSMDIPPSPEGRIENSPGLQAWEPHTQRNRPERAAEQKLSANPKICCYTFDGQSLSHLIVPADFCF